MNTNAAIKESLKEMIARKKREMQQGQEIASGVFDPYANSTLAGTMARKETGIVYDLESLKHKCEWDENYPENPKRLASVIERCEELSLISRCVSIPNTRTDVYERVIAKHTPQLFQSLKTISEMPSFDYMEIEAKRFDSVYFNEHTFDAACRSISCVLNLVGSVAKGEIHNGMALVRPPGHHAMRDEFCGYCYFNNVAIAAEMCIAEGLAKKILIIDYDVHHGQATQQMFYGRNDVLYFSIHRYEHGTFWPNLLESNFNFVGRGEGLGYNINVPLNETGLTDEDYLAIVFNILLPVAYEFNPDLIIVSAGYDAAVGCPEGKMHVTPGFYAHLITLLSGLANGKIAVCLEGGYFLPSLAEGAAMTLKALLGDPCPILPPIRSVKPSLIETINNLRSILFDKWNCFKFCGAITATDLPNSHEYLIKYFGEPPKPPFLTRNWYLKLTKSEHRYYTKVVEALREKYHTQKRQVCYVYDEKMMLHKSNESETERPEKPKRLSTIKQVFSEFGIDSRIKQLPIINRDFTGYNVHDFGYLRNLQALNIKESKDIYFNSATNAAIATAVSGLLTVIDSVMAEDSGSGVAVIRPPGHHAGIDSAMGFCFLNNVAIGANYLLQKYEKERVLIIDFDIHHGNGTQNIFYHTKNVMYLSVHRFDDGKFFPKKPSSDFTYDGHGPGQGFNVNIPFNKDRMGDTEYIAVFQTLILPIAYSYAPEVVLVSAGFDAGINDPLGGYKVSPEAFGHFIQLLKPLAGGNLILCLEGGYNLTTTSYAMGICTKVLLGDPLPMPNGFFKTMSISSCETIAKVSNHFKQYWPVLDVNRRLPNVPLVCKPFNKFTDQTYASECCARLDVDRVDKSDYVEAELCKLAL